MSAGSARAVVEIIDRQIAELAGRTDRKACDARRVFELLRSNLLRPKPRALLPLDFREPRFLN